MTNGREPLNPYPDSFFMAILSDERRVIYFGLKWDAVPWVVFSGQLPKAERC